MMDGDRGRSKSREIYVYKLYYNALDIIETIITPKKTGAKQKNERDRKIKSMI